MRRIVFFTLALLFLTSAFKQKDEDSPLSKRDRLYYTCKIWGFLKYYHPKVGTGVYDWDEKLLSVLKNTGGVQTSDELSNYMSRWIYAFGPRKKCTSCSQKSDHEVQQENFDLAWTRSNLFSEDLQRTLRDIERNRLEGEHYYIGQGKNGQFEPKNESKLLDFNWKEENERLLILFRYWNYVAYFYPHKYQMDQPWDEVLKEMIPKFIAANTKLDFHKAILELVVKTDDSYAGIVSATLDQMPYYNYLPTRFEMIEDRAVITEIIDLEKAKELDLRIGDAITLINGQSVRSIHESHAQYIWGSNTAVKERSIYHTLFMGLTESPTVTIERGNSSRTVELPLYKYAELNYTKPKVQRKWYMASDSVGYADLSKVRSGEVDEMMLELMEAAVIVFDLRGQPKGTHKAIARYLNPSDTTFAVYTRPDLSYPGKFIWKGSSSCGSPNGDYYKGMVILLIDENTQGYAEFTCMCLQTAPNVLTIGSQTAGTDGAVSKFLVYGKLVTSFTGTGIYYPDRTQTQRVGIVPDILVKPTIQAIREGRDETLETAIGRAKEEIAERLAIAEEMQVIKMDTLRVDSLSIPAAIDSLSISEDGQK